MRDHCPGGYESGPDPLDVLRRAETGRNRAVTVKTRPTPKSRVKLLETLLLQRRFYRLRSHGRLRGRCFFLRPTRYFVLKLIAADDGRDASEPAGNRSRASSSVRRSRVRGPREP